MSLKIKEFVEYMEEIAPAKLKESYDNVGFLIGDKEEKINKVLIALDATLEVIEEAKEKGVNLLITHHPLLFRKPSSITTDTLQGRRIIELIKNDINLYASHTNLDSVKNGMNDTIMNMLGFNTYEILEKNSFEEGSGIGRIGDLKEEKTLEEMCDLAKKALDLKFIKVVGAMDKKIKRVAVINGSGQDFFEKARIKGADLIITGDTSYHFVSDYMEMGVSIMDIGHFSSEWPLFKAIGYNIEKYLKSKDENIEVFISSRNKEPYNVIL